MLFWTGELWVLALALGLAIGIDILWGEPASRWHPVVWMGQFLDCFARWVAPTEERAADWGAFFRGLLIWWLGALVLTGLALEVMRLLSPWPGGLAALGLGLMLKPMLAWRMLRQEVVAVESALSESIEAGRQRVSWLCSRDVSGLDAGQVRETAIETLAENLNDSVLAPLFWFVLAGLPGAVLYRFANTADAMWGYRGLRGGRCWTWAGKWAARMDDVLSWPPARWTAALLVLASGRVWLKGLRRQAQATPSPNGGWPMPAMALLLDVRLEKQGVYVLHPAGRVVCAGDVQRAGHLAARALGLALLMGGGLLVGGGVHG